MQTTERKHWLSGHGVRGGWFHSWAWTDDTYGVIFFWGKDPQKLLPHFSIRRYKLV